MRMVGVVEPPSFLKRTLCPPIVKASVSKMKDFLFNPVPTEENLKNGSSNIKYSELQLATTWWVVIRVLAVSVGMRFAHNKRELRGFLQESLFASHIIISQYHTVRKEMLDRINIIGIEMWCNAEHFHRGGYPDGSLVNGMINTCVLPYHAYISDISDSWICISRPFRQIKALLDRETVKTSSNTKESSMGVRIQRWHDLRPPGENWG